MEKKAELKQINDDIKKTINDSNVELICNWVRREENKQADRLSNIAMDNN